MIVCKCGKLQCKGSMRLEKSGACIILFFTNGQGHEAGIYLDANELVNLIKETREALVSLVEE